MVRWWGWCRGNAITWTIQTSGKRREYDKYSLGFLHNVQLLTHHWNTNTPVAGKLYNYELWSVQTHFKVQHTTFIRHVLYLKLSWTPNFPEFQCGNPNVTDEMCEICSTLWRNNVYNLSQKKTWRECIIWKMYPQTERTIKWVLRPIFMRMIVLRDTVLWGYCDYDLTKKWTTYLLDIQLSASHARLFQSVAYLRYYTSAIIMTT